MLTPACANALLKSIEEPSRGYHFILLAQSLERILPTIRSRCVIHLVHQQPSYDEHPLLECFTRITPLSPTAFAKLLETSKPTEQETSDLLDQLLHFLLQQAKQAWSTNNPTAYKKIQKRLALVKLLC